MPRHYRRGGNPTRRQGNMRGYTWESVEQYASAVGGAYPVGTVCGVNETIALVNSVVCLCEIHLANQFSQQLSQKLQPFKAAAQRIPSNRGTVGAWANATNGVVTALFRLLGPDGFKQVWDGMGAALLNAVANVEDQYTAAYASQIVNTLQSATLMQVNTSFGHLGIMPNTGIPGFFPPAPGGLSLIPPIGPGTGTPNPFQGTMQHLGNTLNPLGQPQMQNQANTPSSPVSVLGNQPNGQQLTQAGQYTNTAGGLASGVLGLVGGIYGGAQGAQAGQGAGQALQGIATIAENQSGVQTTQANPNFVGPPAPANPNPSGNA